LRQWHVVVVLASMACRSEGRSAPTLDAPHAAAITDSVRAFASTVAEGVTRAGPGAWQGFFLDTIAFFMASEGQLVFPTRDSATRAIQHLVQAIPHIELQWGPDLRVSPLAPGMALLAASYHEAQVDAQGHHLDERGFFTGVVLLHGTEWKFLNAHWSVPGPPSPVR
jgi:hypothetical protein